MKSKKRLEMMRYISFSIVIFVGTMAVVFTPGIFTPDTTISPTHDTPETQAPSVSLFGSVIDTAIGTTKASLNSNTSPSFSWTPAQNATRYDLFIAHRDTPKVAIVQKEVSTLNHVFSDFQFANGAYSLWVRGKRNSTKGPWSEAVHFTSSNGNSFASSVGVGTVITTTPTGSIASRTPLFAWNAVDNATTYDVYVSKKSTPKVELVRAEVATLSHSFLNFQFADGEYTFWVRAKKGSILGPWSTPMHFTVAGAATRSSPASNSTSRAGYIGTVTDFTVILSNPKQPIVTWQAAKDATHYEVLLRKNGIGIVPISHKNITGVSWEFSILPHGVYKFWVRGSNGSVLGTWSEPVTVTVADSVNVDATSPTPASPSTVGATAGVSIDTTIAGRPVFSWGAVTNATTYHTQLRKNGLESTVLGDFTSSLSWQSSTSLVSGNYTFWVRGEDGSKKGVWSQPVHFTVAKHAASSAIGIATTISTLSPGNIITTRTPKLEWNPVTNATGYDLLLRKNGTDGSAIAMDDIQDLYMQITTPLANGAYSLWMRGRNSSSVGNWSASTDFTVDSSAVVTTTSNTNTSTLPLCEQSKSQYLVPRHDELIAKKIFDAFNQRVSLSTPDRLGVYDRNWVTYYQNTSMALHVACKDRYGNAWEEYKSPLLTFHVSGWRNTTKNEPVPSLQGVIEKLQVYRAQVANGSTTTQNTSTTQTTSTRPGFTEEALVAEERARYNRLTYMGDKTEVIRQCLGDYQALLYRVNATKPQRVNNGEWQWVFYPVGGNQDYALYYRGNPSRTLEMNEREVTQEFHTKYAAPLNAVVLQDCQNRRGNLTETAESDYNDCLARNREEYTRTYNACATNNPSVCRPEWPTCVTKGNCKASAQRSLDLGINYCDQQRDERPDPRIQACLQNPNDPNCRVTTGTSGGGGASTNQCNGSDTVVDPTKTVRRCRMVNSSYYVSETTYFNRSGCQIPPTVVTNHGTDWRCGQ